MADVKSKNLYELLGNTSDQDSDREPDVLPKKTADKTAARQGKRDAPKAAPEAPLATESSERGDRGGRGGRGGRGRGRGGFDGNERAYQDRTYGRNRNREKPTEDGQEYDQSGRGERGGYRGRGSRGGRGGKRDDRHSRTGISEHSKQGDLGWGAPTGDAEQADEVAGESIAQTEIKEDGWGAGDSGAAGWSEGATAAPPAEGNWDTENPAFKDSAAPPPYDAGLDSAAAAEPEPEDTNKSYADYLAEQAAKRIEGLGLLEARQANEGTKENKKWAGAKEVKREDDENFLKLSEEKARRDRDRTRNAKSRLDIDQSWQESRGGDRDRGGRGGRGRGRGDRGDRGDREYRPRGDGEFRGRGDREHRPRGDGEFRGRGDREYRPRGEGEYRGRGDRRGRGDGEGRGRGGRGGRARGSTEGGALNVEDQASFPSLSGN